MQRLVVGLWLAPNFRIQPSAAMAANMQLAVHQCDRLPLYRRLPSAPPPSTVVRSPLLFFFSHIYCVVFVDFHAERAFYKTPRVVYGLRNGPSTSETHSGAGRCLHLQIVPSSAAIDDLSCLVPWGLAMWRVRDALKCPNYLYPLTTTAT